MIPIKIIIIDDHSMIREGLKQLLELDGDIEVIGEAGDGVEGIKLLESTNPDVMLLDINMPNMNGLQVLEELKKEKRNVKILILTIHNEIEYLFKAVEIGVDGYVLKDSNSSILKTAITTVYNGESYIQPSMAPLLKEKTNIVNTSKKKSMLTKRELQVLELLSEGLFNKEIGERLFISEKTVKNHVSSIFKKMMVTDRTQAVVYAIRNNIIDVI
ncbi:MAG: response regulator transcription factor [Acetivibrio sp.]